MPNKDPEKRKETQRNWARRNKDKMKTYYEANREKIRLQQKPVTYFNAYLFSLSFSDE